jgi:hypothetical protein
MNERLTHNDILGKHTRTVTPRAVPHGYQVAQWERNREVYELVNQNNPISYEDFMLGWNAAFCIIYPSRNAA